MAEELRPCPFCGGEAKAFYDEAGGVYEVQCQECGAEPYIGSRRGAPGMRTLGDVMKAWNRRAERTCRIVPMDAAGDPPYRTGNWILNSLSDGCSECGYPFDTLNSGAPNFCPNCGARVEP